VEKSGLVLLIVWAGECVVVGSGCARHVARANAVLRWCSDVISGSLYNAILVAKVHEVYIFATS
jgi:hypothetical protein